MTSYVGIDFAMNRGREFPSHAGRPNGAITIDEMQSCPHRCTSWAQNFAHRLRFICYTRAKLGPRINAEIKSSGIERSWFEQVLRKIVPRDAAICRDPDVSGQ